MTIFVELSEGEWNSLLELRKGPLKKRIPLAHQMKLTELGLASKLFESISVTAKGLRCHRRAPQSRPRRVTGPDLRIV